MKDTYETGLNGEKAACCYLESIGMKLLEQRYKRKCGEIDLVMKDRDYIVFVEVKTRHSGMDGQGLAAIDINKQKRVSRAAQLYLIEKHLLNQYCRFDAVEVCGNMIRHIPNAFSFMR